MVEISVIIPVYNVEDYLDECLNSIVNQTFNDIEIICINDGSTDNSLNILEKYSKDSRFTIISQENKGISAARNAGMDIARGKYIYFIDSDDYLKLTALEELYALCEENSYDLILFKSKLINQRGEEYCEDYFDMPYLKSYKNKVFNYHQIKDLIFTLNKTIYTKFFKKDLISDIRFIEGYIFEDTVFLMEYIFIADKIYFYDNYLYYRRIRDNSTITSTSDFMDIVEICNKISEKLKQLELYDYYKEMFFNYKMNIIRLRYSMVEEEIRESFFNKIHDDFIKYKKEYETYLDFKKLNSKAKVFWKSGLNSKSHAEFEKDLKIHELENKIHSQNIEYLKLLEENRKLKKRYVSLLNSRSWKLTKPFRIVKGLFRE